MPLARGTEACCGGLLGHSVADVKKFEAVYSRYLNEEVSEKLWVKVLKAPTPSHALSVSVSDVSLTTPTRQSLRSVPQSPPSELDDGTRAGCGTDPREERRSGGEVLQSPCGRAAPH